jgi:hypothetical protein
MGLNSSGEWLWAQQAGGLTSDFGKSILSGLGEKIHVLGNMNSDIYIDYEAGRYTNCFKVTLIT